MQQQVNQLINIAAAGIMMGMKAKGEEDARIAAGRKIVSKKLDILSNEIQQQFPNADPTHKSIVMADIGQKLLDEYANKSYLRARHNEAVRAAKGDIALEVTKQGQIKQTRAMEFEIGKEDPDIFAQQTPERTWNLSTGGKK